MTARQIHSAAPDSHQGNFISIAPAVCERLFGEPSGRSNREWRWGRKGSFRLKLDTGTWSDFEAGQGGGVLALVMREERTDKAGALAWLETRGFLCRFRLWEANQAPTALLSRNIRRREIPVQPRN